jgi:uncharacterized iron-regulated membrane protein
MLTTAHTAGESGSSTASRLRRRRLWIDIHLWLGLTVGTLLAVLSLTGTVIGFWEEIYELTDQRLVVPRSGAGYAPIDDVLAAVHAAHPERPKSWEIWLPRTDHSALYAIYSGPEEKGDSYAATLLIAIDPNTGRLIDSWYWGETFLSWVYNVHAFLDLGRAGEKIVGFLGLLVLLSLGTGLYLWWPRGRLNRSAFVVTAKSAARLEYDLHRLTGLYTLVIVAVISLTGVMLIFPGQIGRMVSSLSPVADLHPHVASRATEGITIPASRAIAAAQARFPDATVKKFFTPAAADDTYLVVMRQPAERFNVSHTYTQAWVDRHSGEVLHVTDPTQFNGGTALLSYRLSFHNGEAFGLAGRVFVSVLGVVLCALYVTGLLQWWRRRALRQRRGRAISA